VRLLANAGRAVSRVIMERARKDYDLPRNPIADVDRVRIS
jgi:hypothetical protein